MTEHSTKTSAANVVKRKHRGRPRKAGAGSINPRENIVAIAIKLFREKGYAKTSLSEIARQIGIDQSSIYYWFPSKEAILAHIFHDQNMPEVVKSISETDTDFTHKLYALIILDVTTKCDLPFDFIELETLIHEKKERFEFVFDNYRAVYQGLASTIRAGVDCKEFHDCNAEEKAVTILSISEGLQHHYHAKLRGELILDASGYHVKNYSPEEIGCMAAQTIVSGLSVKNIDPKKLESEVLALLSNLSLQQRNKED